ncbi:LEAF RUST 10 DISEASE-RESISTANCE LOCUS RECEPTOR-LIKE PROTEIN KINASE-like 1.2 [Abrus precatorius]|uniref:non-specific serine/threonine protein kinase n=1 Tax=Abrus precatorius TaxID=3816 RepID=A0A8B8LRJ5_ABRPR|nr:LEAF RUST 10 DISEASE-RESISTANCE LOCUS RECEPTOR-LIKE PROTEIN KINASE-like 1.2 [Abrus precatorius]
MDHHIRNTPLLLTTIATIFFFILTNLAQYHCDEEDTKYSNCSRPYMCGGVTASYPFWDGHMRPQYCGRGGPFKLSCDENKDSSIQMGNQSFFVHNINILNYTIKTGREDIPYGEIEERVCSKDFANLSLDPTLFKYTENVHNITIFLNCSSGVSNNGVGHSFLCPYHSYQNQDAFFVDEDDSDKDIEQLFNACNRRIQVQALRNIPHYGGPESGINALRDAFIGGFEVKYNASSQECIECTESKGACGGKGSNEFTCYCRDGFDALNCNGHSDEYKSRLNRKKGIIIGVSSLFGVSLVAIIGYFLWQRRKKNSYAMPYIQSRSLSSDPSLKDTEKGSLNFAPGVHLFSYDELEEATNYFDSSRELGEGGFGTVYFGKLRDGRCVAVKRLYENNCRRVEQFMNEIKILARLVHPNLVSLYGCTSRHSRELLLVYEYISNGTVADHLHGGRAKPGNFPWHIRMNIAVETASALKYLHVSDIIHRDVKTNNILLDDQFRVKVADFGLSRLFPNLVTHISTAPQGTPGYVDPEYHECYQLTIKSDVYSFGVVLIELISSLPAVDITRHRHEINLANMAINKIHTQALHELVDPTLGFESDYKVKKMINAVAELAFQCLQSSKDMRPSMDEVYDTLKDIQSGSNHKSQPEVMDISSSADDVVLLKDDPPPPSPDSNAVSKSTTPNASG